MSHKAINLAQKFSLFTEPWQPKVIAEMNDYQFKLVRLSGDFVWHDHLDTDETFMVIAGELRIDFENGSVTLKEGEMFVVPRGCATNPMQKMKRKSCSSSLGAWSTPGTREGKRRRRTMFGFSVPARARQAL